MRVSILPSTEIRKQTEKSTNKEIKKSVHEEKEISINQFVIFSKSGVFVHPIGSFNSVIYLLSSFEQFLY